MVCLAASIWYVRGDKRCYALALEYVKFGDVPFFRILCAS